MRSVIVPIALLGAVLTASAPVEPLRAQSRGPAALTGLVSSAKEGPMEGVLVSAKKSASTITITVVSNRAGRYWFPQSRLEPGEYTIRIRAAGYELARPATGTVAAHTTTTVDLQLQEARDVAAQLTNAEWLSSFPGTDAQKASIRGCTHCHTLERIARTRYDVDRMVAVIERMSTYPQLSFPQKIQKLPAPRIGGGQESPEQRRATWRRQAEYLTTVNLSAGPDWTYSLKTLPRPKGRATDVIYTEYDLPQRTRQPHDVIVDSKGLAWYASFGEQVLGALDPRTGKVVEHTVPTPGAWPYDVTADKDGNVWTGGEYNDRILRLDPKTGAFIEYLLPRSTNVRRVFVDDHTTPPTFWVGNNHGASIVKLEPLEAVSSTERD